MANVPSLSPVGDSLILCNLCEAHLLSIGFHGLLLLHPLFFVHSTLVRSFYVLHHVPLLWLSELSGMAVQTLPVSSAQAGRRVGTRDLRACGSC